MLYSLQSIQKSRKRSVAHFLNKMSKSEWFILYFLSALIIISLSVGQIDSWVLVFIIFSLAAINSYMIYVANLFDQVKWRAEERIFEPYARAFESIGQMRYYPEPLLKQGTLKIPATLTEPYRVGTIADEDWPDASRRVVSIVNT